MDPKLIIAGGNGFLGTALTTYFQAKSWEVVCLTRKPDLSSTAKQCVWDARSLGDWTHECEGAAAVINLCGRSVDCRYTPTNRALIINSRVESTEALAKAIRQLKTPPKVWLNSSSATIYRHTFGQAWDESCEDFTPTPSVQDEFSLEVIHAWEQALYAVPLPSTRRVALRTTMVLGHAKNSVFPVLCRLARLGLGGRMGTGKQFVSWLHVVDFCRAIDWILEHPNLTGPINLAAPNPLPNAEMMTLFRRLVGMPLGLPAMEWMLEIGAIFLRTETELILKSRRVVPGKLLNSGFQFQFPTLESALSNLQK